MRTAPTLLLAAALLVPCACGATQAPQVTSAAAAPAEAEPARTAPDGAQDAAVIEAPPPPPPALPRTCAGPPQPDGGTPALCVPDADYAKRLCAGSFPEVALALFAKDTPFTRVYMRGDVDGWNADGGGSARARLRFDEELLVLRRRTQGSSTIIVGASAGYLVMRWDGNCYTLQDGEVTTSRPPSPKYATLAWRSLSERTRDVLLDRPNVLAAYQKRGKECKGAFSGEVTRACEEADRALSAAVIAEIRGGVVLPEPERVP